MDSNLIPYQPVISDIKNLITSGQNVAYNAVNRAMIMTYWNVGTRVFRISTGHIFARCYVFLTKMPVFGT